MSREVGFNNDDSPNKTNAHLQLPSPIITRRNRTASTSERALENPVETGKIKSFCRERGHGFVTSVRGGEDLFVHISDIEGEYVPLPGDEVMYRLCPIPPKFEKNQAVHVRIVHLTREKHLKWDEALP
ncbi:cold shock domain-containing protein CG9705 [Pieris rapae]|uniref:cold shock domain-containing protein CG9705 n=1 Tax=Pieris rapae TaxID=64459 RepID=UPI000B927074|nr:cold shock domain-containing protein CG9705 [Pieris rapae]